MEDEIVVNGVTYVKKAEERPAEKERLWFTMRTEKSGASLFAGENEVEGGPYCAALSSNDRGENSTVGYFWSEDLPDGWEFYVEPSTNPNAIYVNIRRKKANG